jgi:hypothetical protein
MCVWFSSPTKRSAVSAVHPPAVVCQAISRSRWRSAPRSRIPDDVCRRSDHRLQRRRVLARAISKAAGLLPTFDVCSTASTAVLQARSSRRTRILRCVRMCVIEQHRVLQQRAEVVDFARRTPVCARCRRLNSCAAGFAVRGVTNDDEVLRVWTTTEARWPAPRATSLTG